VPTLIHRLKRRLARIFVRAAKAQLGMAAAAVAFYGFLAVFPGIALVIALWSIAADPEAIRRELEILDDFLPPDAFSLLSSQVEALMAANSTELGWTTILSLLVAFWSARAGVAGMISGLNAVHHRPDHGSLRGTLLALVLTLGLISLALLALVAALVVPLVISLLPLGALTALALELANTAFLLALVVFSLGITYRFGPNRAEHHQRPPLLTVGLLVALVLWFVVSRGFVIYLANFNTYNRVYGSIGAVVILLIWMYLSAYAVLFGAAVDAERAEVPEPGLPPVQ
jgi:membrane protein